jgi:transcriptional repressor NrdR
MLCPKCIGRSKVIGTSTSTTTERFRKCRRCGYTFTTIEAIKFDDYWREYAKETFESNTKEQDKKS